MDKISVIIPIYNVEKFLVRCLDSVINQSFNNIEIICVNDCSSDNSLKILERYAKKDKRIIILNREKNAGPSAARNSGLKVANGEYIYFLDSDDWIEETFLEKMYEAIITNNDNAVCTTKILNAFEDGTISSLLKREFKDGYFKYTQACQMAWSWLLKKSFLDKFDFVFPENLKYEDMFFFHYCIRTLGNVHIINNAAYYHFENKNSIMGNAKNRVIDNYDIIEVLKLIYNKYKEQNKLKEWSIPFFYMPKYMISIHSNKSYFFSELKAFYNIIKEDVFNNINLYSELELNFFKEILYSNDYDTYKKNQTSIIGALRKNIRWKNERQ